jgi:hypothetical protein
MPTAELNRQNEVTLDTGEDSLLLSQIARHLRRLDHASCSTP